MLGGSSGKRFPPPAVSDYEAFFHPKCPAGTKQEACTPPGYVYQQGPSGAPSSDQECARYCCAQHRPNNKACRAVGSPKTGGCPKAVGAQQIKFAPSCTGGAIVFHEQVLVAFAPSLMTQDFGAAHSGRNVAVAPRTRRNWQQCYSVAGESSGGHAYQSVTQVSGTARPTLYSTECMLYAVARRLWFGVAAAVASGFCFLFILLFGKYLAWRKFVPMPFVHHTAVLPWVLLTGKTGTEAGSDAKRGVYNCPTWGVGNVGRALGDGLPQGDR